MLTSHQDGRDKRKTSRKHQDRSKAVRSSAALVRRICGSPGDAAPWGCRWGGGGFITGRGRRRLSQAPSSSPLVYIPRGHITLVAFNQNRCQIILRGFCSECSNQLGVINFQSALERLCSILARLSSEKEARALFHTVIMCCNCKFNCYNLEKSVSTPLSNLHVIKTEYIINR